MAANGLGNVAPNPLVGAVIVHNDKVIGEGYHQLYGEAHAEVNAIQSVADKSILPQSTIYVNLEPCAHYGKTPPCADLIIEHGFKRVVIANEDPFPEVLGKGIERIKKAGITVTNGVLKEEGEFLNRRFFTFHSKKRPYIILKWAQTNDGFIDHVRSDGSDSSALKITNKTSNRLVHKWRATESAILIGKRTALLDNPRLTNRSGNGKNPMRIVIDLNGELPQQLNLFSDGNKTVVATRMVDSNTKSRDIIPISNHDRAPEEILDALYARNIQSLIIEGGSNTLNRFIDMGLWDEARVFTSTESISKGIAAPLLNRQAEERVEIDTDILEYFRN
ncbi:MAG: bifunctional diaminohydroxyphosphoribosylaminopyrimidine deaminase/5-amino-6-(5-phosphoribosylamino)uracil reductase RibD [Salibacteraceae bacterium]